MSRTLCNASNRVARRALSRSIWAGLLLILSPLLLPQPAARAQSPLTLDEAQALAARHNEISGIARARLDQARALRRQAWTALFPSLTARGTYTRRTEEQVRQIDPNLPPVVVQRENALSGQLDLELDLFDARAYSGLSVTARGLEAQALESEDLERTLAFDVAESFFAVLSSERLRDAAERRLEVAAQTVDEAKSRVEAGLAAKNEATRTELEHASAQLAFTLARTGVQRARLSLSYLIGAEVGERPLADPPLEPLPSLDGTSLEGAATDQRPDFLALLARVEQADALALEPLLRLVPTLGLRGSVFASNELGFSGKTVDANLSATLTWVLFDGGTRYAERDLRLAQAEEAELRAEERRRVIALEVRSALIDVETARATLAQAEVQARVAAQNAEEVRTLFGSGLASALEQVDAAVAEFEATAGLERQRVSQRVAELTLLRAIGRWPARREKDDR